MGVTEEDAIKLFRTHVNSVAGSYQAMVNMVPFSPENWERMPRPLCTAAVFGSETGSSNAS